MLSELKDLDPADERFDAKMSVLMENVRHHVEEEEEREWFPDVRKAMGRNHLTELGEQMEAAKKKAPGEHLAVPNAEQCMAFDLSSARGWCAGSTSKALRAPLLGFAPAQAIGGVTARVHGAARCRPRVRVP
ncbi:hypothetical protein [Streptomyces sp. NPDC056492]|uniref:hypothetical protein n=1 Tax=unclassified Streptomyces TaxID=2593676 RepID=UPI00367AD66C